MTLDLTIDIGPAVADLFRAMVALHLSFAAALSAQAGIVFAQSQFLVPVDTGALRHSGYYATDTLAPFVSQHTISYGGGAVTYALIQHENAKFRHAPPTMFQFLKVPFDIAMTTLVQDISRRMAAFLPSSAHSIGLGLPTMAPGIIRSTFPVIPRGTPIVRNREWTRL